MSNPQFFLECITNYSKDFSAIQELLKGPDAVTFGPVPHSSSLARYYFGDALTTRIKVQEKEGDHFFVGYAELQHHPPISALPPDCWMDWFRFHFCRNLDFKISKTNTVFLNFFISKKEVFEELLQRIILECFLLDFKTCYVIVVAMPQPPQPSNDEESEYVHIGPRPQPADITVLRKYGTLLLPKAFCAHKCKHPQMLYVIKRETLAEGFRFRKGLPEDNDDIMEIIELEQPEIRKTYGEFFVAEELLRELRENDPHCHFIIAEKNHNTIGFIWANDNVNVVKMVKSYECEAFGNLIKFNPEAPFRDKLIRVKGIQQKPYMQLFNEEVVQALFAEIYERATKTGVRRDTCGRPCCPKSDSRSPKCTRTQRIEDNILNTKSAHFRARFDILSKIEIVNETLLHHEYFQETFKKNLHLYYNVMERRTKKSLVTIGPEYRSNVFAIQMLGVDPSMDKRYAHRFIKTAFSAYPDKDYCIIALPHSAQFTPTLRLIVNRFIPMIPRPRARLEDNVYIIHRSTVFGELTAHKVVEKDLPAIESILRQSQALQDKRRSVYPNLNDLEDPNLPPAVLMEYKVVRVVLREVLRHPASDYKFLIIRCGSAGHPIEKNTVVGFAIIRTFLEIDKVNTRFVVPDPEAVFEKERAEVLLLRLHPNYRWESDVIFRQIAILTGFREFYYACTTTLEQTSLPNDLASHMQPIEPRNIMHIHTINQCKEIHREESAKMTRKPSLVQRLDLLNSTYALFFHNTSSIRYYAIEETIVIVGFNFVSRALIRALVFNFMNSKEASCYCCLPRLRVIVISRPGVVEADYDHNFKCRFCENQADCWINFQNVNSFLRDTTLRMDLRRWVTFISARLRLINREKQTVTLENGCQIYYSKLILSPALRFGLPMGMNDLVSPPNYVHINSRFDKILLYHKIMAFIDDTSNLDQYNIIIYGIHLNTYECINFLITHRIPPKFITLVIPHDPVDSELHLKYNICYADKNIENILAVMVEDLGVNVKDNMVVKRWQRYYGNENISHIVFEQQSDNVEIVMLCDLFISYYDRHINTYFFDVLTKSKITTGNNYTIIVNENFQTTCDKNIFAIGACTEQIATTNHQYLHVSYKEIADKMIYSLNLNENAAPPLIEKFSRPVFYQAQLPLGYYITKVIQPRQYLANHLNNDYRISLTTYDGNFSRVRLNEHGIVEEIVCVTNTRRELDHLQFFVGKHEKLLNDLYSRWYLKEINSFVDYFEEPWTELIMHPGFPKISNLIKRMATDTARDIVETYREMSRKERQQLMKINMRDMNLTSEIEKLFLKFLSRHRSDFIHPFALPEDFADTGLKRH